MSYRNLDPEKIIETMRVLRDRIAERFPAKSLPKVADELLLIASETRDRVSAPARRVSPYRVLVLFGVFAIFILVAILIKVLSAQSAPQTWGEIVQAIESLINELLLMGAAIFFLFSLESRIHRK